MAKLPRPDRFEELLDFPTRHEFKVIGRRSGLSSGVRRILDDRGHEDVILVERESAKQRYVSLTFKVKVESGVQLDELYSALEQLPGIACLL